MKDKNYKMTIISVISITLIIIILSTIINIRYIKMYNYNENVAISNIIDNVLEKYPDVSEEELIRILNNKDLTMNKTLNKYGINLEEEAVNLANQNILKTIVIFNIGVILLYCVIVILLIKMSYKKRNNNIKEIINYLKEINNKNYCLQIDKNMEDELSILRNEIYKTAITLNEQERISRNDKENLKEYLSDISHQIKTPLTSINLMIDNLIENKNINNQEKKELLKSIRHKTNNINFLIQSLLTLSKFDANAISFHNNNENVRKILDEVVDNTGAICDLKNIIINIKGSKNVKLFCDYKWQVEALTNIVKNCIEHSKDNSKIDISYMGNDLFTKIIIKDYGEGMNNKDLKNIFKRFYKGNNSSKDSVGIGLSLAKVIIEKNNGYISVDSKKNEGTTFIIKYLK